SSMMRFHSSDIPTGHGREYMFDLDMLQTKPNDEKKRELKRKLEDDPYIRYLINAIRYACGLQLLSECTDA
ncbi:MAG: hypothetical protein IKG22_06580, partial [Atopobiaceae bacterium]|nr:hypothetical protein [Atopobiaceae bacterium]